VIASRAGPAVFKKAYGPVTATSVMFASGVETRHGSKWASSSPSPTSTKAVVGLTPNARAGRRYVRAKQKAKRSMSLTAAMLLRDFATLTCDREFRRRVRHLGKRRRTMAENRARVCVERPRPGPRRSLNLRGHEEPVDVLVVNA
jgi:hypothetical protein